MGQSQSKSWLNIEEHILVSIEVEVGYIGQQCSIDSSLKLYLYWETVPVSQENLEKYSWSKDILRMTAMDQISLQTFQNLLL